MRCGCGLPLVLERWIRYNDEELGQAGLVCGSGHGSGHGLSVRVKRVALVPYVDEAGELVTEAGVRGTTLLLLAPELEDLPAVPVAAARELLMEELLGDFPFADESDRANALALLLLPMVRAAIEGPAPLHRLDNAPSGAGKSLLGEVLLTPGYGRVRPTFLSGSRVTQEKELARHLRRTAPPVVVFLDNVDRFDLPMAKSAIDGRVAPEAEATWLLTPDAESFNLDDALRRRSVPIRLKPSEARWQHRHYPVERWVWERRRDVVAAGLAVVREWATAGMPRAEPREPVRGFEAWSFALSGVIGPDFLGSAAAAQAPPSLLAAWHERHGERWVTADDVWADPELRRLAERHVPSGTAAGLGMHLAKLRGRPAGGLVLEKAETGRRWRVAQAS